MRHTRPDPAQHLAAPPHPPVCGSAPYPLPRGLVHRCRGARPTRFTSRSASARRHVRVQLNMSPKEMFTACDEDGSGKIGLAEFEKLHSIIAENCSKMEARKEAFKQDAAHEHRFSSLYKKLLIALAVILVVMLGGNAGLTAAVVYATKDTKVSGGVLRDESTGLPLKVASTDTSVAPDGHMVNAATGKELTVGENKQKLDQPLSSCLPDSVWNEIKYVEFTNAEGGYLHLLVQATVRKVVTSSLHGSTIIIYTAIGQIELDGLVVTFKETMAGAFSQAGFEVTSTRRRLQGAFDLMGLFNSVPAFENLCEDVETPTFPTTFHAQADQLHACLIHDGTLDVCRKYGVPHSHMQDSSGKLATEMTTAQLAEATMYARVSSEMWSDAASGMERESFSSLANFPGWTFDRVTSASTAGSLDVAQTWDATGETFFCRTEESHHVLKFDASKYAASYKGTKTVDGTEAMHFLIKSKESEGMTIDYYVTQSADANLVIPLRLDAHIVTNDPKWPRREIIFKFKVFEVLSSVASSIFWGGSSFSPSTTCASTNAYTANDRGADDGSKPIPSNAMIGGTAPFFSFFGAPDSTVFFAKLNASPSTTAAQYAALLPSLSSITDESVKTAAQLSGRLTPAQMTERQKKQSAEQSASSRRSLFPKLPSAQDFQRIRKRKLAEWGSEIDHLQPAYDAAFDEKGNRRALGHDLLVNGDSNTATPGNCNMNAKTDGNCPDSCSTSLSDWLEPVDLPCDVTLSLPHICNPQIECDIDSWGYPNSATGPLVLGISGSIALDCTPEWDRCAVEGCVTFNIGLGIPDVWDFTFATVTFCMGTNPVSGAGCGFQKYYKFEVGIDIWVAYATATVMLYDNYGVSPFTPSNRNKCLSDGGGWGKSDDGEFKIIRVHVTAGLCPFWCFDVYNSYIIG